VSDEAAVRKMLGEVIKDVYADARFALAGSGRAGAVHSGFKDALDAVYPRLAARLDALRAEKPTRPVFFTGHSLGAALATLGADRFGGVRALYTFGSPLVGDEAFARGFRVPAYRIVNNNDVVARVPPIGPAAGPPPTVRRYVHVGDLRYIDHQGQLHHEPSLWAELSDRWQGVLAGLHDRAADFWAGGRLEVPFDHFTDHAPLYYALHLWNAYVESPA